MAMLPPAVNYTPSYTFPPVEQYESGMSSSSALSSAPSSLLPSSQSSPTSAQLTGAFSPPPLAAPSSTLIFHPSPAQVADRLDSLRPESLQLPKSTTSPLSKIPHSMSLPTLPPSSHGVHPALFAMPTPDDADVRALDSSIGILQMLLHVSETEELSTDRLRRHLAVVLEALAGLKSSSVFRSTDIHHALFQTLALRRSTSETVADQEVVDWISHEYLTPRRGSTSSDGGGSMPLSHSVSHASALQAHHHSAMHHGPHDDCSSHQPPVRRHQPLRSNSLSAVTLRAGSHPSLEALQTTVEARPVSPLVRATNLIRIITRMASSRSLSKDGIQEEESKQPSDGEEKSDARALDAEKPTITPTSASQAARRKSHSHLDLPAPAAAHVTSSAANISAPFLPNAPSPKMARSPSSKALLSSSSPSSRQGGLQSRVSSASSPHATPSPLTKKPPKLISPSSSSPSPYHSSPSSANAHKSLSRSRSSSSTPSSDHSVGGPLYSAIVDRVLSDPLHALLSHVDEWSFDIFALHALAGPRTLSCVLCYLFDELSVFDKFNVRRETFAAFIGAIEDGYNAGVPYHNSVHAADVLVNTYFLLQTPSIAASVTSLDVFASLIAAAVHDFGHPGTNNAFQIATQSDYALRYNDLCVLESMHASEAFFVLRRPDHNILDGLSASARAEVRSTIIHQVLATDMQQHFKNLSDLRLRITDWTRAGHSVGVDPDEATLAVVDRRRQRRPPFHLHSTADRLILLANTMHAADLGNPCKPLQTYLQWTERLIEEFYRQGDRERELGLPVSLMMDRSKPNVERSQVGFVDVICQPLWATMAEITPELAECLDNLQANRDYWLRRLPPATPKPHSIKLQQGSTASSATSSTTPSSSSSNLRAQLNSTPSFIVPAMS